MVHIQTIIVQATLLLWQYLRFKLMGRMMKTKLIQWQINRDDNQLKHWTPVNEGKEFDTETRLDLSWQLWEKRAFN